MGTPVRILDDSDDWWRIQLPDGYIAWVPDSSVAKKTAEEMDTWRTNPNRYIVTSLFQINAYKNATTVSPREMVSDLGVGVIVVAEPNKAENGRMPIPLPDGRQGWAPVDAFAQLDVWVKQSFDVDKILDTAYSLEGAPYLWGANSCKAVDCSGMVKVSYYNNAIILRRDASQQALTGKRLGQHWSEYIAGDLLFFGNEKTGRVTHVGIYDADAMFVHSSGRVKRNSLDPEADSYLYSPLHAVRIQGYEGTDGITRVENHPWYYNQK